MKKRVLSFLVTGLVIASLAGCGAKADATDQSPESSVVGSEADDSVTDESAGLVEADGEKESSSGFVGAEDENIVLYAEIAKYGDYTIFIDGVTFTDANDSINAAEDVPVFNEDGIEVGYVKSGSTVSVTESGSNAWARFENPIAGTDYDYLYVLKDYVTDGNLITITTADAENIIKEELAKRDFDAPVFTSVTDDLELYEFRIPSTYDYEYTEPNYEVDRYFTQRSDNLGENESPIRFYKTYSVVCTEDTDGYIICQVYYKDVITDEEWDTYGR